MKRWILLLALALPCWAQTQGNVPQVKFACSDGSLSQVIGSCALGDNVVSGQTLVSFVSSPVGAIPSFTDTLGNTFTCTSAVVTPAPDPNRQIYACYAQSAFSGADTLTACAVNVCHMTVLLLVNVGAFDLSASVTSNAAGVSAITNSITPTVNGALLVSGFINGTLNGYNGSLRDSYTSGAADSASLTLNTAQQLAGAKGAQNVVADNYSVFAFGANPTAAILTLAFKPSTIMLTDTAMPDAASGIAYSAQLHGVGGTAALTYACTGLPANGFSLNTATGKITATTPTATTSIGCTVTDGTLTSATDSLTITDKASFSSPAVRSIVPMSDSIATSVSGIHCGDIGVFFARGDDTHDTTGWLQSWNGTNNFVIDGWGSPITRYVGPWGNGFQYAISVYIIGPFNQSGTNTVTINNNQSASSNRGVSPLFVISGAQAVVDSGSTTNVMTLANTSTVSAAYTVLVPNTLLLSAIVGSAGSPIEQVGTPSMAAPFSADSTDSDALGESIYGHYLASTTGAVTLTNNVTGQGTTSANTWSSMIVPIRAGLAAATCPAFNGLGEKYRRTTK